MRTGVPMCLAIMMLMSAQPGAHAAGDQAELLKRIEAAPPLQAEDVCTPVAAIRSGRFCRAPNPDGKTWDILKIYYPLGGYSTKTIVAVDTATDEVKQFQFDEYCNLHFCPWVIAPNGKLFIAPKGRDEDLPGRPVWHQLMLYDPATNELTRNAVPTPKTMIGERSPLVVGPDGMLYYMGSHPERTVTAIQVNPDTLAVTDYGPIGPSHAPEHCWCHFAGVDHRYIYLASGKIPWYIVAFDRETRTWQVLATTAKVGGMVYITQEGKGCVARVARLVSANGEIAAEDSHFWLYDGRAIPCDDPKKTPDQKPPWDPAEPATTVPPAPELRREGGSGWIRGNVPTGVFPPAPEFRGMWSVPDTEGNAEIWYRPPEAKAKAPKDPPADARPEDRGWKVYRYRVPLEEQYIHRLTELPDGRLFGSAGAYQGNFVYDPKTGECRHLGRLRVLSHYATAIHEGKIYMSGYALSPLCVYDPSRPWTAHDRPPVTWQLLEGMAQPEAQEQAQLNPRMIMRMGGKEYSGAHKMYAACVGADGRIYFGGRWARDGACGGFAWWDPKEEKVGGFWQLFSNYQISHVTASEDRRLVVISTLGVRDPVLGKPTPKQGKLFIYDTTQHQIVREIEPVADEVSGRDS